MNVHNHHAKSPFFCQILTKLEFWKNAQISNFMKIRPLGAELFHANGQTTLMVAFRKRVIKHTLEKGTVNVA
jgi:hypothetical protein